MSRWLEDHSLVATSSQLAMRREWGIALAFAALVGFVAGFLANHIFW